MRRMPKGVEGKDVRAQFIADMTGMSVIVKDPLTGLDAPAGVGDATQMELREPIEGDEMRVYHNAAPVRDANGEVVTFRFDSERYVNETNYENAEASLAKAQEDLYNATEREKYLAEVPDLNPLAPGSQAEAKQRRIRAEQQKSYALKQLAQPGFQEPATRATATTSAKAQTELMKRRRREREDAEAVVRATRGGF
jgi:hypothetical protein